MVLFNLLVQNFHIWYFLLISQNMKIIIDQNCNNQIKNFLRCIPCMHCISINWFAITRHFLLSVHMTIVPNQSWPAKAEDCIITHGVCFTHRHRWLRGAGWRCMEAGSQGRQAAAHSWRRWVQSQPELLGTWSTLRSTATRICENINKWPSLSSPIQNS